MRAWKLSITTKNCSLPPRPCCARYRISRCRVILSISRECGRLMWLRRLNPDNHDAHFQGLFGPRSGEDAARAGPCRTDGESVVRGGAAEYIADVVWLRRNLRDDANADGIRDLR